MIVRLIVLLACLAQGTATPQRGVTVRPAEVSPLANDGAPQLPSALITDDECTVSGGADASCGLSALQWRSSSDGGLLRAVEASKPAEWHTSCVDFGCGDYVPKQACQCNLQCHAHGNCCHDVSEVCAGTPLHGDSDGHGGIMTLYHQTSTEIGPLILEGGFKPGRMGWCGGAIYFAMSPQATTTKARSMYSHQGFMIEAVVRLGRVKHMGPACDMTMTAEKLHKQGYDTIRFNPVDGDEYVVFNSSQVISTRHFPWKWHL